ncbi:MAG: hypothetical protein OXC10_20160 [Rhodospirillaceae bacterium]|nr:hypothetical protein [Rhodospirillaceae bacterium]
MTAEAPAEDAEDAAGAPCPHCGAPDPLTAPAPAPRTGLSASDPDHPQWVRRRRKLNILFGASLATFLGVGLAAIANMVRGLPVDPNAASVMWPLGSAAAAATGLYVWQGVRRSDGVGGWQNGWRGDRWAGRRSGDR